MRRRGPGFGEVLGVREFRALWAAELCSILGDQLARVALALLVFRQTSSAALTALTYALTFAPAVLGGALLSGLADRYPRRTVLVTTDLLRAALAATMAIPSLSLPALWALVGLLSMSAAPFKAAQLALLPQILTGDRYVVGLSLRQITGQSAQLVGFATGGLLLAAVEPHVALALNAGTFLASAGLVVLGVRSRPAPVATARPAAPGAAPSAASGATSGAGPLSGSRRLLPLVALVSFAGLFVVPEGVAAPYGSAVGTGSAGVGLLMAADPLGSVIGAWLVTRVRIPPSRPSVVLLAVGAGVPLMLCATQPGLVASIAFWAMSGVLATAQLIMIQALVVELVPDHRRGRTLGRIATYLYASQGLAIVAGGLATQATSPFRAVAAAGLLGAVLALCVGAWWRRVARSRRDLAAGSERGSAEGGDWSHVPVRHDKHLLPNRTEQGVETPRDGSHVPVRHDEHLLPNRTERGSAAGQGRSHVPIRHDEHLLPTRTEQSVETRERGSHVPIRHDRHLLPILFTRTWAVNWSNERFMGREFSSRGQATSLWVCAARAFLDRFVARGMAAA
jgi:MFS family permease